MPHPGNSPAFERVYGPLEDEILRLPLLYGVLVVPASAVLALGFRRLRSRGAAQK